MDFFTCAPPCRNDVPHVPNTFAEAVCFKSPPPLTATLDAATTVTKPFAGLSLGPRAGMTPQAPAASDSAFAFLTPAELGEALTRQGVLVLDIRPNATYNQARLPGALSLSVPSTLLKRPAFSLEKVATMVRPSSRQRFSEWRQASSIILYDGDTSVLTEGNNVLGLLRKFHAERCPVPSIFWVRGGFTAVWREARHLVDESVFADSPPRERDTSGILRAQNLPMAAFQQSSTTTAGQKRQIAPTGPTSAGALPPMSSRIMAANPFYDNIRQNVELSQGVSDRIRLRLPERVLARKDELPFQWLRDIVDRPEDQESEALAMQFYRIELGEQRRLQGVMDHHSQHPFEIDRDFPYSIIAGVEKGFKNRYRNIWPFEHTRVRLGRLGNGEESDYVNASYVQPLGTKRRYIATQGPLPATYNDFWKLCWEQNVAVIVMLTRQVEGAHVKCGEYWAQEQYGTIQLQHIKSVGPQDLPEDHRQSQSLGFGFAVEPLQPLPKFSPSTEVIRRTFYISNVEEPAEPKRLVTQIQYLGWPDLSVPDEPDGLLWVINEVNKSMQAARQTAGANIEPGPVLLHCSAGVGRTGGFIVIDAVLDGIRRELRRLRGKPPIQPSSEPVSSGSAAMDVELEYPFDVPAPVSRPDPEVAGSVEAMSRHSQFKQAIDKAGSVGLTDMSWHNKPFQLSFPAAKLQSSRGVTLATSVKSAAQPISSLTTPSSQFSLLRSAASLGGTAPSSYEHASESSKRPGQDPVSRVHPIASQPRLKADWMMTPNVLPPRQAREPSSMQVSSESRIRHKSTFDEALPLQSAALQSHSVLPSTIGVPRPASPTQPPAERDQMETHSQATFDFTNPRALYDDGSPVPLSSLQEPVRQVLEDMREQRMSLCQSLRQYVFVHRAIIEGVLAMMDQEADLSDDADASALLGLTALTAGANSTSNSTPFISQPHSANTFGNIDASLRKRPSLKRKQRSEESSPEDKNKYRDVRPLHASLGL